MSNLMELIDAYANHRMVDGSHDLVDDHPDTLKARTAVVEAVEKLEKDALRYVWVRENLGQMIVSREYPNMCTEIIVNASLTKFDEASLEAALDKAMEATNGQGD